MLVPKGLNKATLNTDLFVQFCCTPRHLNTLINSADFLSNNLPRKDSRATQTDRQRERETDGRVGKGRKRDKVRERVSE